MLRYNNICKYLGNIISKSFIHYINQILSKKPYKQPPKPKISQISIPPPILYKTPDFDTKIYEIFTYFDMLPYSRGQIIRKESRSRYPAQRTGSQNFF